VCARARARVCVCVCVCVFVCLCVCVHAGLLLYRAARINLCRSRTRAQGEFRDTLASAMSPAEFEAARAAAVEVLSRRPLSLAEATDRMWAPIGEAVVRVCVRVQCVRACVRVRVCVRACA
jgi:hypothetical protein